MQHRHTPGTVAVTQVKFEKLAGNAEAKHQLGKAAGILHPSVEILHPIVEILHLLCRNPASLCRNPASLLQECTGCGTAAPAAGGGGVTFAV